MPVLLLALVPGLGAVDPVAELVQAVAAEIPSDELVEPGNTRLAVALDALITDDLPPAERAALRLHSAGAWLTAGQPEAAKGHIMAVLEAHTEPTLRHQAGLLLVALWQHQVETSANPEDLPDAVQALAEHGAFATEVTARAQVVEALRQQALGFPLAAIGMLDQALEGLGASPPELRVPVYSLRILAMEAAGEEPEAVAAWVDRHREDPAVAQLADSVLAGGHRLLGSPAPKLAGRRVDGTRGMFDLAEQRGTPVLVYFMATWSRSCAAVTPTIVALDKEMGDGLQVVAVSLDSRDTLPDMPAYRAAHGIDFPIIGEGLGWDGELDDIWHVEAIPALMLVDDAGIMQAVNLEDGPVESLGQRIRAVLRTLDGDIPAHEEDIP